MKSLSTLRLTRGALAAAVATVALVTTANADIYDLASDWSDTNNPNGVWSYLIDQSPAQWGERTGDSFGSPGAPSIWGAEYNTYFGWSKSNGSEQINRWDLQIGDVYGHTTGLPLQVAWTAPTAGSINFAGGVWALRDIGRTSTWRIDLDGDLVAAGSVSSGDPYNRTNPLAFGGSGLAVEAGDTLLFGAVGIDYFGLNLSVDFTARQTGGGNTVPDATSTVSLLAFGLLGLAGLRRRMR
jgi:hypothetical protein